MMNLVKGIANQKNVPAKDASHKNMQVILSPISHKHLPSLTIGPYRTCFKNISTSPIAPSRVQSVAPPPPTSPAAFSSPHPSSPTSPHVPLTSLGLFAPSPPSRWPVERAGRLVLRARRWLGLISPRLVAAVLVRVIRRLGDRWGWKGSEMSCCYCGIGRGSWGWFGGEKGRTRSGFGSG